MASRTCAPTAAVNMSDTSASLGELPITVLIHFARTKDLPIPEADTKRQLVDAIAQLSDAELHPLLHAPPRFEVRQEVESRVAAVEKRIAADFNARQRSLEHLQSFFRVLGAALALMLGVGSIVGGYQLWRGESLSDEARLAVDTYQDVVVQTDRNGASALVAAITLVVNDADVLMSSLGTQRLNEVELEELARERTRIEGLLAATGETSTRGADEGDSSERETARQLADYRRLLLLLSDFYSELHEMSRLPAPDERGYLQDLKDIQARLSEISTSGFRNELATQFARQIDAWRHNAIGVLSYYGWRVAPSDSLLQAAAAAFGQSIEADEYYPRAYANLALIHKRFFNGEQSRLFESPPGGETRDSTIASLRERIGQAQRLLTVGLERHRAGSRSVELNNLAFYLLTEATLLRDLVDERMLPPHDSISAQIEDAWNRARETIPKAEVAFPVNSVVYTTRAEIEAFGIGILSTDDFTALYGASASDPRREEKFGEILRLLRRAVEGGYLSYSDQTLDEIYDGAAMYRYLARLEVRGWEDRMIAAMNPVD